MFKTFLRYLWRILLGILILISGYFIVAIIFAVLSTTPEKLSCDKDKRIFVATNGVHLDIIIPKEHLNEDFRNELNLDESVKFIAFGWGDKAVYLDTPTWNDLKFSTAFRALFLRGATVLHLTFYSKQKDSWILQQICESQLNSALDFVEQTFARNDEGKITEIKGVGYADNDTFYEATGFYNCIRTSNEWVNISLKKAKIKTAIWSPFDKGVLYQLRKRHNGQLDD